MRYRCAACGNLTRFDVVTERRVKEFQHFSVGGELSVEDEEVLAERVIEISCRWCGHGRSVEGIDQGAEPAAGSSADQAPLAPDSLLPPIAVTPPWHRGES